MRWPGRSAARRIFVEREGADFELRRGFEIPAGARVLVVEDIVSTGQSLEECLAAVARQPAAKCRGAACLIDRSGGRADLGVPLVRAGDGRLSRLIPPTRCRRSSPPCRPRSRGAARSSRDRANSLRLGVNIDHVATIRNARGGAYPDPIRAALVAQEAGADGITAHLREDRRHIIDEDIAHLIGAIALPLNMEMAATEEMVALALKHRPHAACIVPERREEVTTEGGLDAAGQHNHLQPLISRLADAGIRVSLFIEPDPRQIEAAMLLGAPVVEFHTGRYAHAEGEERATELRRIADAAALAVKNGIEPHAGHGLTFDNVQPIAAIPQIAELNIGHFLIGEAIFTGLDASVRRMRSLMDEARG